MTDDDYYTIRTGGSTGGTGGEPRHGSLRVAIVFAAGALAVTLVAVPLAREHIEDTRIASRPLDLDTRAVGSLGDRPRGAPGGTPRIGGTDGSERYVVRRSVLSNDGVCVIRGNGRRTGDC